MAANDWDDGWRLKVPTGSGSGAVDSVDGRTGAVTLSDLYQPLDADLTSWAAITRASGFDTFTATPSSANLASLVSNETGSGALVFGTAPTLSKPQLTAGPVETVYTITDGAGFAIDPTNGTIQVITLGANRTPTVANFDAGQSITMMIADGTAYTITWTTIGVVWVAGSAPILATSGYSVVVLWRVGSTYYGTHIGDVA
jgi:hypothetical protein